MYGDINDIILPIPLKNSTIVTSIILGNKGLEPIDISSKTIPITMTGFLPSLCIIKLKLK